MRNTISWLVTIFFCRKEFALLAIMALAVPFTLIYRGAESYQKSKAEAFQQKAIKLIQEGTGPDLVVLNLDLDTDIADIWTNEYRSNPNIPVLATYQNKINGSSSLYIYDVVDFKPIAYSPIPTPNLFIKIQGVDALGMYYAFRGPDALAQANRFLERNCFITKIAPPEDAFHTDLESGQVSDSWSTQLNAIRGNKMGARMWWSNQYYVNTCTVLSSQSSSTPKYIFMDSSAWNYCEPVIDQIVPLREVN